MTGPDTDCLYGDAWLPDRCSSSQALVALPFANFALLVLLIGLGWATSALLGSSAFSNGENAHSNIKP